MRPGFFYMALPLFFLALPARSSGTIADSSKRLVLIESPACRLSKSGREQLRTAIGDVVVRHGIEIVPSQTLPEKLLRCDLPDCLPQIAAASGAALVLRVEAKYAKESFTLGIELWNSDQGKLLGREARDCPICDEQDLWGSAALLVQGLLDRASQEREQVAEVPPSAAPTMPPKHVPSTDATTVPATEAQPGHSRKLVGYAGLALAVVGASLLATGVYYVAVDGKPTCDECDWDRDTAKYGRPIAIGGGAVLAVGAGLLLWRFWPSAPAVSLGPSGVLLAGRF
jgi:hypothetical protein